MKNIQNLTIDINKKPFQTITANVGEVASRFIRITILENNIPADLTGVTAYLYAKKVDGTKVFNSVTVEDAKKGIVLAELTSQVLAIPGLVRLTLLLTKDGAKLASKQIIVTVDESAIDEEAIQSTNEFNALTDALKKVNNIDNKLGSFQNQIDNLVLESGGDSNLEVVQARGEYSILNDRLSVNEDGVSDALIAGNNSNLFIGGEITNLELELKGWMGTAQGWVSVTDRATTVVGYHLEEGDTVTCDDFETYNICYNYFEVETGAYKTGSGWLTSDYVVTYDREGIYYITIKNVNSAETIDELAKMRKAIRIYKKRTISNTIKENDELNRIANKKIDMLEDKLYKTWSNFMVRLGTLTTPANPYIAHTPNPYPAPARYYLYNDDETGAYEYAVHVPGVGTTGWKNHTSNPLILANTNFNNTDVYFIFRKADDSELTVTDCENISKCFRVVSDDRGDINILSDSISLTNNKVLKISEQINGEFALGAELKFENKTWGNPGWSYGEATRATLVTPITSLVVGDTIEVIDPNYMLAIYDLNEDETGNNQMSNGWVTKYTMVKDSCRTYIQIRRVDNGRIDKKELDHAPGMFVFYNENNSVLKDINDIMYGLKTYSPIFEDSGITIGAGEYYIGTAIPKGNNSSLVAYIKTDDLSGNYASHICLRQRITSTSYNDNRVNAKYKGNGVYMVEGFAHATDTVLSDVQCFIDLRDFNVEMNIEAVKILQLVEGGQSANNNGELAIYVSPNGDDSNTGLTPQTAVATVQQAINMGATTVLCARGTYYNPPAVSSTKRYGRKISIIPYESNNYDATNSPNRPLVHFVYAKELDSLAKSNGVLTQPFEVNHHLKSVFIDKTREPIDTSNTRSVGYHSTIWQIHEDETLDVKLKPVLTLKECQDEKGTFFYDGVNIYVNPFETEYIKLMVPDGTDPFNLNGYSEVVMHDIQVDFGYARNFSLTNNMNMTIKNCHSKYTMLSDGFCLDNSNCNLYNCTAFKSRNDGFNIHAYGESNFYNCSGYYNYDDGISHHDGCIGIVDGGEWHHNGKGGISSPTYGSYVDIYNVYCHHNNYGVYGASDSAHRPCKSRIFNSVLLDNNLYDLMLTHIEAKVYNTKYGTKKEGTNTTLIEL